jgi:hypothetical protein
VVAGAGEVGTGATAVIAPGDGPRPHAILPRVAAAAATVMVGDGTEATVEAIGD